MRFAVSGIAGIGWSIGVDVPSYCPLQEGATYLLSVFFLDPVKFGDLSRNRVIELLNATGNALRQLGSPVDVNAGIKAANQVLGIS